MKFLLCLFTALSFVIYLPCSHATSSSTQNPLFERVDDLLTRTAPDEQVLESLPNNVDSTSLVSMNSEASSELSQAAPEAGGGGDTLFGDDFSVTVPDEEPNLLADVNDRTQALAQENETNPQEDRLMNNDTEAQPPAEEIPEVPPPTPDFGLNPDLNPEMAGYAQALRDVRANPDAALSAAAAAATAEAAPPEEPVEAAPPPAPVFEAPLPDRREATGVTDVTEEHEENVFFGDEYEGDKGEPRALWSVGYTLVVCIILTAFLIIIVFLRNLFNKYFNAVLLRRISYASRDVITILIVVTLILWLKFLGVHLLSLPLNEICLGLSVFALGWLFWSIILVIYGQAHSVNWEEKEIEGKFRDRVLKEYRELFDRLQGGEILSPEERKIFKQQESQIRYSLLRQNFILPSYLPVLTESFLREDFNFASYLTLCLEKAFTKLFKLSLSTMITILGIVIFWIIIAQIEDFRSETIVFGTIGPIISLIVLMLLKNKFSKISSDLRTPFTNPHNIEFIKNDIQKDPWANLQNPLPPYLNYAQEAFEHPKKIFQGQRRPNLQEMCFWQNSPLFSLTIIHSLSVFQIVWATIFYGYYAPDHEVVFNVTFTLAVSIIFLINVFYLIPSSLVIYNTIANIEMRKDRELIKKVVEDQRALLRQALLKLYRLLKSARREFSEEASAGVRLREFTIKMIKEAFRTITEDDSWEIEIHDLPRLVHLCGSHLEKDELVYLARGASEDLQTIFIDDFIETIEVMAKDVKLDPYETSNEVLRSLAVREDDFFVLKEFKELLINHKVLPRFDIEEILHELRLTSANGLEAEIPNISSLIRDSIEENPR